MMMDVEKGSSFFKRSGFSQRRSGKKWTQGDERRQKKIRFEMTPCIFLSWSETPIVIYVSDLAKMLPF